MSIPKKFLKTAEGIISVGVTDVISGKVITTFYGGETVANDEELSTVAFDSDHITKINSRTIASLGVAEKSLDVDYDVKFQVPTTIEGVATANISIGINKVGSGTTTFYGILKARKWDGTTETELASDSSLDEIVTVTGAATVTSKRYAFKLDIPKTDFRVDDTLRLTVEVWVNRSGTNGVIVSGFGQDAANRDDDGEGTATDQVIVDADDTTLKFIVPNTLQK